MTITELTFRLFYKGKMYTVYGYNIYQNKFDLTLHVYDIDNHTYMDIKLENIKGNFVGGYIDRPVCRITNKGNSTILYENDIVEIKNIEDNTISRHVVEWGGKWKLVRGDPQFMFALVPCYDNEYKHINLSWVIFSGMAEMKIIGNTHQNKDLLPEGYYKQNIEGEVNE